MAEYTNLYKWLVNGGSRDANVDGSATPVEFSYTVPAGNTLALERLIIYIQDAGTFDATEYGSGTAMTNGLDVEIVRADSTVEDLLDGEAIKTNSDWSALCYDYFYNSFGVGDNSAAVRWTFGKSGAPLMLETGDKFVVRINDALTVLTAHHFNIQGILT